jgi:hypothetical protein
VGHGALAQLFVTERAALQAEDAFHSQGPLGRFYGALTSAAHIGGDGSGGVLSAMATAAADASCAVPALRTMAERAAADVGRSAGSASALQPLQDLLAAKLRLLQGGGAVAIQGSTGAVNAAGGPRHVAGHATPVGGSVQYSTGAGNVLSLH